MLSQFGISAQHSGRTWPVTLLLQSTQQTLGGSRNAWFSTGPAQEQY